MKRNQDLKKFYNAVYIKGEKKHFTNFLVKGTTTSEIKEILKEVSWKNKLVLDVGCGTGLFAYKAAREGAKRVLGIDYSGEAIKIAQENHRHSNLQYSNIDVKSIKEKYDVIVSIGTLEHMDNPLKVLKVLKKHLTPNGKIIITSPNWTNPRGYILMTLFLLFDSPITLADLHYQTPIDFQNYANKLKMNLKWRTIDKSWAHGEILITDFQRRIPNVLRDSKLPNKPKNIQNLIDWIKNNVISFDNSLKHSGATGLYVFSFKKSSV